MLTKEEHREDLEELLSGEESLKARLLWEIFFETEVDNLKLLEARIYQYGTMVKADDYLARELFVRMVFWLNKLKSIQKNQMN